MANRKTKAAIAAASVVGVLGMAGSAYAAGAFTITPNTGLTDQQTVQLSFSGFPANTLMFARQCRGTRVQIPTLSLTTDCGLYTEDTTVTSDANGAGVINYVVTKGQELNASGSANLPWSCVGAGDTVPAGVTKVTSCTVRLTDNTSANNNDEQFQTLSFADAAGVQVPESRYAVLLPLGGLAVLAGAFFVVRNRKSLAA
jgi:hypothetical protein